MSCRFGRPLALDLIDIRGAQGRGPEALAERNNVFPYFQATRYGVRAKTSTPPKCLLIERHPIRSLFDLHDQDHNPPLRHHGPPSSEMLPLLQEQGTHPQRFARGHENLEEGRQFERTTKCQQQ